MANWSRTKEEGRQEGQGPRRSGRGRRGRACSRRATLRLPPGAESLRGAAKDSGGCQRRQRIGGARGPRARGAEGVAQRPGGARQASRSSSSGRSRLGRPPGARRPAARKRPRAAARPSARSSSARRGAQGGARPRPAGDARRARAPVARRPRRKDFVLRPPRSPASSSTAHPAAKPLLDPQGDRLAQARRAALKLELLARWAPPSTPPRSSRK